MAGKTGRRLTPERLFLMIYIPLALAMMLMMPLGGAPDEQAHLRQSWLASTGQFRNGPATYPANLLSIVNASYSDPDAMRRQEFLETRVSAETVTEQGSETTGVYPKAAYLPQGIMMFLARLFTDRLFLLLYSARTGCVLAAGILFYFAIRRIPAGKYTMLAIACLPLTLQEAASASCDGMTIAGICWIIAELLRRISGTGERLAKQLVISAMIGIFAVLCKVMYIPVLRIGLAARTKTGEAGSRKWLYPLVTAGALLGALLIWYLGSVSAQTGAEGQTAGALSRLGQLAGNPAALPAAQVRTAAVYGPGWIRQLFGVFGHLNIFTPWALAVPLGITFLGVALTDSGAGALLPDRKQALKLRVLLVLAFLLCWTILSGAMMIWWTEEGSSLIEGIQGRYFLPCIICLLICLPEVRSRKEEPGKGLSPEKVRSGVLALYLVLSAATVAWLGAAAWHVF